MVGSGLVMILCLPFRFFSASLSRRCCKCEILPDLYLSKWRSLQFFLSKRVGARPHWQQYDVYKWVVGIWEAMHRYMSMSTAKTNKMTCAPSEDADQPGHPPCLPLSVWRKFSCLANNRSHSDDWSDWEDAQADLSLGLAQMLFCWFCRAPAQLVSLAWSNYF